MKTVTVSITQARMMKEYFKISRSEVNLSRELRGTEISHKKAGHPK